MGKDSEQLRIGHIYLSLGAGPSSSPFLPLQMCLLLQLLPPNSHFLGVVIKVKKKKKLKKASAQGWASPGSWGLAPGSSASHAHFPMGTEQAKAFVVC